MCQENTPAIYYLTIFDLNNWYIEWMPRKMQIYSNEFDSNGKQINGRNTYLTNFILPLKSDLADLILMKVVDSKLKTILNRNKLSSDNTLNDILESKADVNTDFNEAINFNASLSMNFEIMVLTKFTLQMLAIKPIEQEIHDIISKQEDLIYNPDVTFDVLFRYNLIDKYLNKANQTKFITIFDYLFDTDLCDFEIVVEVEFE